MKIGLCFGTDGIHKARVLGADYIEPSMSAVAGMPDEDFEHLLAEMKESEIKCEAMNILFPGGDIMLVGPEADEKVIDTYLDKAIERAGRLGVSVLVFGSGKARNCPDGFSMEQAEGQLVRAVQLAADKAERYGIAVAIEPLSIKETNMVNFIDDAVEIVKKSNRNVKVVADYYHMMSNGDSCESIVRNKDYIIHMHIASEGKRLCPSRNDGTDYTTFFSTLREIGYDGRVSIEGMLSDEGVDIADGIAYLKELV